jgi:hypothetical protein
MSETEPLETNGAAKAEAPPAPAILPSPPSGKGAEHVAAGPKPVRMTELEKHEIKRLHDKLAAKQAEFTFVALEIERLTRARKDLFEEVLRADTDFKARAAEAAQAHGILPGTEFNLDWGAGVIRPKGA